MVEPLPNPPAKFGRRLNFLRLGGPRALAWSPDGKSLVIFSGFPSQLTMWRPSEDRVVWTIPYAGSFDRPITFTGDGRYIVTWPINGSTQTYLTVLDPTTGKVVYNIPAPSGSERGYTVESVAASQDGRLIAFRSFAFPVGRGWRLDIYSTDNWTEVAGYSGTENEGVARLAFAPHKDLIVSASIQYTRVDNNKLSQALIVRLYDINNANVISDISEPTISRLNNLSVSPDGINVAISVSCTTYKSGEDTSRLIGDTLLVYSLDQLKYVRAYPRLTKISWDVSWNQKILLILAQDSSKLALWDSESSLLYDSINNNDGLSAKFRPDGLVVAYIDSSCVVVRKVDVNLL